MCKAENNYAFIDSQNVNLGIRELGWILDFQKFRIYLGERFDVRRAYLFIGYIPQNRRLYTVLENYGYELVFKEVILDCAGKIKGNIDAELVLQAMIDYENYNDAVIVSGDGDFACLARYLDKKGKLKSVLAPDQNRYSQLLDRAAERKISFINKVRTELEYPKIKSTT
jgi:uncharacterized LabA/DUF88 family protein